MNYIILSIFIILQIADVISTAKCLSMPDRMEANKLLKAIMNKIGVLPALILTKLLVIGLVGVAFYLATSIYLDIAIGAVNLFYVWVVVNNVRLLKK